MILEYKFKGGEKMSFMEGWRSSILGGVMFGMLGNSKEVSLVIVGKFEGENIR